MKRKVFLPLMLFVWLPTLLAGQESYHPLVTDGKTWKGAEVGVFWQEYRIFEMLPCLGAWRFGLASARLCRCHARGVEEGVRSSKRKPAGMLAVRLRPACR